MLPVYHSLFQSHILYALPVWSNLTKKQMLSLQTIQNKAIRNGFKLPKTTRVKELYTTTKLLPFEELIKVSSLIQTHNMLNNLIISNTRLDKNHDTHRYPTRTANHLRQHTSHTTKFGTNSIRNKATLLYNAIPVQYKNLNKKQFKRDIKKFIRSEYEKN